MPYHLRTEDIPIVLHIGPSHVEDAFDGQFANVDLHFRFAIKVMDSFHVAITDLADVWEGGPDEKRGARRDCSVCDRRSLSNFYRCRGFLPDYMGMSEFCFIRQTCGTNSDSGSHIRALRQNNG